MEKDMLAEQLGVVVRGLRLEAGYSQAGFAGLCYLERAYMGMVERGEVNVSVRTVFKIATGLGLSLGDLFLKVEQGPSALTADISDIP